MDKETKEAIAKIESQILDLCKAIKNLILGLDALSKAQAETTKTINALNETNVAMLKLTADLKRRVIALEEDNKTKAEKKFYIR